MTVLQVVDIGLAALVLLVASWSIFAREAFAAVVAYVAYGLLLALVWVRLFAVDVAMTEAAIGGGVTGVLLIGAAGRLRKAEKSPTGEQASKLTRICAAVLCTLVTLCLAGVVLSLPEPAPTLASEARQHLPGTEVGNPITAVLLAFRSFDTMLEKVVLVFAVVGVWSLASDRYWGGTSGPPRLDKPEATRSLIAQVLPPLGILIGVHMVWVGADEPGGAFQGGAILAAMWMMTMMARLTEMPSISSVWLRFALIAGPAVFVAIGTGGTAIAEGFFSYPVGFAKPLILFIEAFMTLSIAVTLAVLVGGPPRRMFQR